MSRGILSWGDFVLGGILSRGILSGGFCPGGFCPGGFCPDTGQLSLAGWIASRAEVVGVCFFPCYFFSKLQEIGYSIKKDRLS